MNTLANLVWKLRIWKDTRGQDLIEYALMAGFVAVAAGAIMPGVASSIKTIFAKIERAQCLSVAGQDSVAKLGCEAQFTERTRVR